MNTRITALCVACLGLVGSFANSVENPANPTRQETQARAMEHGIFQNRLLNRQENLDMSRIEKLRDALRNDPDLVPFVAKINFKQNDDTLVILGVVNSQAVKDKIADKIKAVQGVKNIDNQLKVEPKAQ